MSNMIQSFYNMRLLDEMAEKKTIVHSIHPLMKLLTTFTYIVMIVSFDKYNVGGLMPFVFYPVILVTLGELPVVPLLKRLLFVIPFVVGIGIWNPLFDNRVAYFLGYFPMARGWISLASILMKCVLTALAALILIATTGIYRLASAFENLRIPRILILQFLLTYRYIAVLMEEGTRILRGYSLRSPGHKGIQFRSWGSLAGQLLIRTYGRAQRVYHSMSCRGFTGQFEVGTKNKITVKDIVYFSIWTAFFITVRFMNISSLLGLFMTGVGR